MDHLTRWDIFTACFAAMMPLLAVFVAFHLQSMAERRKDREQRCREEQKLEVLIAEYPLHDHMEQQGPLKAEGIRWPAGSDGRHLARAISR